MFLFVLNHYAADVFCSVKNGDKKKKKTVMWPN